MYPHSSIHAKACNIQCTSASWFLIQTVWRSLPHFWRPYWMKRGLITKQWKQMESNGMSAAIDMKPLVAAFTRAFRLMMEQMNIWLRSRTALHFRLTCSLRSPCDSASYIWILPIDRYVQPWLDHRYRILQAAKGASALCNSARQIKLQRGVHGTQSFHKGKILPYWRMHAAKCLFGWGLHGSADALKLSLNVLQHRDVRFGLSKAKKTLFGKQWMLTDSMSFDAHAVV